MPVYNYKCETCGSHFSRVLSIAERNDPCEEPCPEECEDASGEAKIRKVIDTPPLHYGLTNRNNSQFREVVNKVKSGHPLNTIPDDY